MKKICFNLPTIEQVKFTLEAEYEDIPVRGNAIASGDDEYDRQVEDEILERLDSGDIWAWCNVKVTARYKGMEGEDYLGGCSYKDEEDFKAGGYYEDMKQQAYQELLSQLQTLAD